MIYLVFLAIHIVLCALVFLGIAFRILSVHKYMFFVALLLPFWGVLIVLLLHFQIAFDATDSAEIDVEKLKLESELYRSITVDEKSIDMTIPIEEALIINSARERRSIIMDVLNDNPAEYIEFLQKAGNNEDTEVVHYAVSAMVEISKENDFMLQKLETAYSAEPDNIAILSQYCDFLWNCLAQNLMQGHVETMNRELFSQLMQKKISVCDNIDDYKHYAENELKRNHFDSAGDIIDKIHEKWPYSEEYIILKLQYLASMNKGDEINSFVTETKNSNVYLSSKAKEALAFWTK